VGDCVVISDKVQHTQKWALSWAQYRRRDNFRNAYTPPLLPVDPLPHRLLSLYEQVPTGMPLGYFFWLMLRSNSSFVALVPVLVLARPIVFILGLPGSP